MRLPINVAGVCVRIVVVMHAIADLKSRCVEFIGFDIELGYDYRFHALSAPWRSGA